MVNSIFIGFGKFILCPIWFSVGRKNAIVMIDTQYNIYKVQQTHKKQLSIIFGSEKGQTKLESKHSSFEHSRISRDTMLFVLFLPLQNQKKIVWACVRLA